MKGNCKNCGGPEGIHHYETMQCPVGGVEAVGGRHQTWMHTHFEEAHENLTVSRIWHPAEIAAQKKRSPNALYPDTILWGMEINGISNPSVATVLEEIINAKCSVKGSAMYYITWT